MAFSVHSRLTDHPHDPRRDCDLRAGLAEDGTLPLPLRWSLWAVSLPFFCGVILESTSYFLLLCLLFLASHCFFVVAPAFLLSCASLVFFPLLFTASCECYFSYFSCSFTGFSPLLSFFSVFGGILIACRNVFFFVAFTSDKLLLQWQSMLYAAYALREDTHVWICADVKICRCEDVHVWKCAGVDDVWL